MAGICCAGDNRPGPIHLLKFRYTDDICSFLVVAHSLSDAHIFANRIVRLEEIFPSDSSSPRRYHVGHKTPLQEGGGFLASFDLTQSVRPYYLQSIRSSYADNSNPTISLISANDDSFVTV